MRILIDSEGNSNMLHTTDVPAPGLQAFIDGTCEGEIKCTIRVKLSVRGGRAVDVIAQYANASPISSISEPLAATLGLRQNGHIFVAGFGNPSFPASIPSDPVDIAFSVVDASGTSRFHSTKVAPVILPSMMSSLVLGKDWLSSYFGHNTCSQEYGPAYNCVQNDGTGERIEIVWGLPDRGPGYIPDSIDMGHNVRQDAGCGGCWPLRAGRVGTTRNWRATVTSEGARNLSKNEPGHESAKSYNVVAGTNR